MFEIAGEMRRLPAYFDNPVTSTWRTRHGSTSQTQFNTALSLEIIKTGTVNHMCYMALSKFKLTYILSFWYLIFKLCNNVASLRNIKEPVKRFKYLAFISTCISLDVAFQKALSHISQN